MIGLRTYTLEDLLYLMDRLRDPQDGCPWDLKQTFASILPHTLEETYEVADTIERQDWSHLGEELGDLLFQVVFYARLGKEQGQFDFEQVVDGIVRKLLRRHPHVFPDGTLESRLLPGQEISEAEIKANWERIKQQEKQDKPLEKRPVHWLDDVPAALPSVQRAEKLQKRAAVVGFDWPEIKPVFAKIREELDELEAELTRSETVPDRLEDELGDVLFCCLNLARFLGVNGDKALRGANQKFIRRFNYIEDALAAQGKTFSDADLDGMDALWNESKTQGL
ncbi:MAG: nucleoside triphosphate pyrophosphohydrolase [Hahellaceae bacterium]|nr:nucleoside triphosphate pyrophosphohydrolase [Hahellaceae bacterium]